MTPAAWWRRWRRERTLARRPIPDELWRRTLRRYPFLGMRPAADAARLRELATLFLAGKEFSGAHGLHVSDAMAVAIAAQACLPVLRLGLGWYDGFVGIVVHADAVVATREVADEAGVVHRYQEELSGEAMHGGPVMLAWRDVDDAGESAADGYNVVVHEFAHVIDMRGGLTAGAEDVGAGDASARGRWLRALVNAYDDFGDAVAHGEGSIIDAYGAESVGEFFAVASEAFFVAAPDLRAEWPALYDLLRELFMQDPADTTAAS